jgi:hypothetical protein
MGKGTLLVLTSGWHPSDSQLALSSKFVPLLYSILEYGGVLSEQPLQYFVGDHVSVPHSVSSPAINFGANRLAPKFIWGVQVRKPDDSLVSLEADQRVFTQTDMPGIYAIESSAGPAPREGGLLALGEFAVNLPAKESQTAVMQIEDLEKLGVSLSQPDQGPYSGEVQEVGTVESRFSGVNPAIRRTGLEYEQKVWRWVFIALLAVSLIEIWLAGWLPRPPSVIQGEQK